MPLPAAVTRWAPHLATLTTMATSICFPVSLPTPGGGNRNPGSLMNKGASQDYKFDDVGTKGVAFVESYASPTFGDIDNDGDLDLYFATVYSDNSKLWKNNFVETGNLNFTDISATWNINSIVGGQQTTFGAFGDYNNDGFLDLFTANKLLENDGTDNGSSRSSNSWLKVRLEGNPTYDATAIGSQVRIEVPGLGTLTRQVEGAVGDWG